MKVGIIRCMQTEDFCPGSGDFMAARQKKGAFADIDGDVEIVGFTNCGGCPGKRVLMKAKLLLSAGAKVIAVASCINKGTPIGYPCPFREKMMELLEKNCPGVRILDHTH